MSKTKKTEKLPRDDKFLLQTKLWLYLVGSGILMPWIYEDVSIVDIVTAITVLLIMYHVSLTILLKDGYYHSIGIALINLLILPILLMEDLTKLILNKTYEGPQMLHFDKV